MMSYFWGVIFDSRINIRFLPSNVRFCGVIPLRSDIISARSLVENHWILLNLEKDYILNIVHLLIFFYYFHFQVSNSQGWMEQCHPDIDQKSSEISRYYINIFFCILLVFCCLLQIMAGNALARVQRVHKPADLWDITFCTR